MRRLFTIFSLFLCISFAKAQDSTEIIKFAELETYLADSGEQLLVINFWATWCRPCVKELPYFDEAQEEFGAEIKVILVSLDFVEDYETRLIPFLKAKQPQAKVVLLDEPKYNTWIDKVSEEWSGAIPATIFVQGSKGIRHFVEGEFEHGELNKQISILLKK